MNRGKTIFFMLMFGLSLSGNSLPEVHHRQNELIVNAIAELEPSALVLSEEFEAEFRRITSYPEQLLVSLIGCTSGAKYTYVYMQCSAVFYNMDGDWCLDHRTFLVRRKKSEKWKDMEIFLMSSLHFPSIAQLTDEEIDDLLKAGGHPISPEYIRSGLCE